MADKKISALTGATTPLAGTEVLPIVQGGSTVKVSVANLTAGRSVSASNLLVQTDTGLETVLVNQTNTSGGALARVRLSHGSGASGIFEVGLGYGVIGLTTSGPFVFSTSAVERMRIEDSGNLTIANGNLVVGTAGKGIDFSANGGDVLSQYDEGTWTPNFSAWTTAPTFSDARYIRIGSQVTVCILGQNGVNAGGQAISGLPFTSSNAVAASGVFKSLNSSATFGFGAVDTGSTSITAINAITFASYWAFTVTYFVTF